MYAFHFHATNPFPKKRSNSGSLEITLKRNSHCRKPVQLSRTSLLIVCSYNSATGQLTVNSGQTLHLKYEWDFSAEETEESWKILKGNSVNAEAVSAFSSSSDAVAMSEDGMIAVKCAEMTSIGRPENRLSQNVTLET